jgi:hypothetical protein
VNPGLRRGNIWGRIIMSPRCRGGAPRLATNTKLDLGGGSSPANHNRRRIIGNKLFFKLLINLFITISSNFILKVEGILTWGAVTLRRRLGILGPLPMTSLATRAGTLIGVLGSTTREGGTVILVSGPFHPRHHETLDDEMQK